MIPHCLCFQYLRKLLERRNILSKCFTDRVFVGCQYVAPDVKRTERQPGAVSQRWPEYPRF